jgi:hypothetical protein
MNNTALEQYLHEHIPLSAAMGVKVVQADPQCVVLTAPLAPNINHRDTVFGGSASGAGDARRVVSGIFETRIGGFKCARGDSTQHGSLSEAHGRRVFCDSGTG